MFSNPSQCDACLHYQGADPGGDPVRSKICAAYPDGIPMNILMGISSHWEPMDDRSDNGISFQPAEGREEMLMEYIACWYDHEWRDDVPAEPDEPPTGVPTT